MPSTQVHPRGVIRDVTRSPTCATSSAASCRATGNEIDDDCVDGDAPGLLSALIKYRTKANRGRTRVQELHVHSAPPGTRVEVICRSKRCPFKRRTRTTNAKGDASLRKLFKQRLRAGLTIEVRATYPNTIGKVWRFRTHRGDQSMTMRRLCLPPNAAKPSSC